MKEGECLLILEASACRAPRRSRERWPVPAGEAAHIAQYALIYIKHESMGSGVFVHKYRRAGLRSGRIHHR